jgi:ribosome biogenesis GTPase
MKEDHPYDEDHYFQTRRESRFERKLASKLDRSKYKKTDQEKRRKHEAAENAPSHLLRGIVTQIRGREIIVQTEKGSFICTLRGALKKEKNLMKTAVIVGDRVFLEEQSADTAAIAAIEERSKTLSRADHLSQKKEQLLAANVDLVCITTSVVDPPLRPSIIDRYLIAAEKGGLTPILIINKIDLLTPENHKEHEELASSEAIYRSLGIPVIKTSTATGQGLEELLNVMKDKISVFSGQSGSGKSSLINATCGLDLKVGKTVHRYKKGAHTTSFAQLLPLPCGGFVVDTPGIKSFGVWALNKDELKNYFHEIQEAGANCLFTDCLHKNETGCAIPDAIAQGKVSQKRFDSYRSILATLEAEHMRR